MAELFPNPLHSSGDNRGSQPGTWPHSLIGREGTFERLFVKLNRINYGLSGECENPLLDADLKFAAFP